MAFGDCTESGGGGIVTPLVQTAGSNELDVTKWGAQRINLTIMDVQKTIQEGIAAGPITPFNISGNTIPGSQA